MKTLQDLLNLWIERGAMFHWNNIQWAEKSATWYRFESPSKNPIIYETVIFHFEKKDRLEVSATDILFSPESNFFEVLFPTEEYGGIKAWEYEWEEMREEECVYISRASFHKMQCVVSPDPIQYCIDNIQRPE